MRFNLLNLIFFKYVINTSLLQNMLSELLNGKERSNIKIKLEKFNLEGHPILQYDNDSLINFIMNRLQKIAKDSNLNIKNDEVEWTKRNLSSLFFSKDILKQLLNLEGDNRSYEFKIVTLFKDILLEKENLKIGLFVKELTKNISIVSNMVLNKLKNDLILSKEMGLKMEIEWDYGEFNKTVSQNIEYFFLELNCDRSFLIANACKFSKFMNECLRTFKYVKFDLHYRIHVEIITTNKFNSALSAILRSFNEIEKYKLFCLKIVLKYESDFEIVDYVYNHNFEEELKKLRPKNPKFYFEHFESIFKSIQ